MEIRQEEVEQTLHSLHQEEEPDFSRAVARIVRYNIERGRLRKFLTNETVADEAEYVRLVAEHYRRQRDYVHGVRETDDPAIWEPLFVLLQKAAYRSLTALGFEDDPLQRYDHAKTCASEAGIVLVRRPFPFDTNFKAWAFNVVRFVCQNYVRKNRNSRSVPPEMQVSLDAWDGWAQNLADPASTDAKKRVELQLDLLQCIADLSAAQRQFVLLHYFEHKSYDEIAELMGRNKNALYKLNFDALNNLRKNMLLNRHNYE